jgi:hypothetical protein
LDLSPTVQARLLASPDSPWAGKAGAQRLARSVFAVAAALAPSVVLVREAHRVFGAPPAAGGAGEAEPPSRLKPFLLREAALLKPAQRVWLLCCTAEPGMMVAGEARKKEAAQMFSTAISLPLPDQRSRCELWRRCGAVGGDAQVLASLSAGRSVAEIRACAEECEGGSGLALRRVAAALAALPVSVEAAAEAEERARVGVEEVWAALGAGRG